MLRPFPLLLALLVLPAGAANAAQPLPRPVANGAPAASRAAANGDLPSRLGDLLRQLDYDQSRKLTRQIEPAQSVFTGSDLATAVAGLKPASPSAVLVVGRRGPLADSPLEIEQTLAIPPEELQPTLRRLDRKARTRSAYVPRAAPDNRWASLVSGPAVQDADKRRLSKALSTQGSAAFLFVMQPARVVQKIIIIPDTVKITVSGTGAAPPPQARQMPMPMRPDIRRPSEIPPDYPMPEPPPEPEPVDPPSDDTPE